MRHTRKGPRRTAFGDSGGGGDSDGSGCGSSHCCSQPQRQQTDSAAPGAAHPRCCLGVNRRESGCPRSSCAAWCGRPAAPARCCAARPGPCAEADRARGETNIQGEAAWCGQAASAARCCAACRGAWAGRGGGDDGTPNVTSSTAGPEPLKHGVNSPSRLSPTSIRRTRCGCPLQRFPQARPAAPAGRAAPGRTRPLRQRQGREGGMLGEV